MPEAIRAKVRERAWSRRQKAKGPTLPSVFPPRAGPCGGGDWPDRKAPAIGRDA
jgi:hypothetical protein